MTTASIPTRRVLLYGGLIGLLAALNIWRVLSPDPQSPVASRATEMASVGLPDLLFDAAPPVVAPGPGRELFRAVKTEVALPPPPPPPPPPKPDPVDPKAEAIARANRILDGISIIGIMGSADNRVAVIKKDGSVETVNVGTQLIPGFVIRRIEVDGLVVGSGGLQFERRIDFGGN